MCTELKEHFLVVYNLLSAMIERYEPHPETLLSNNTLLEATASPCRRLRCCVKALPQQFVGELAGQILFSLVPYCSLTPAYALPRLRYLFVHFSRLSHLLKLNFFVVKYFFFFYKENFQFYNFVS